MSLVPPCARRALAALLPALVLLAPRAAAGQANFDDLPRARILLLGTFHFDDPGLDDYRPEFPWDPLTADHQREIEEVVELLARFRPTRIALEWPASAQARLDSLYGEFLAGRAPLNANERQQLGFRLARALGQERVYAIDAPARSYVPDMTQEEYDRRVAALMEGADASIVRAQMRLEARYQALYRQDDSLKVTMPLRDYLLRENEPAQVAESHGAYLIGSFRLGRGEDYLGPDMRTRWYNRNLRIVHNIQRITASYDDRIFVIIGSGHLPILRHAFEASPEYRLVEVSEHLRR